MKNSDSVRGSLSVEKNVVFLLKLWCVPLASFNYLSLLSMFVSVGKPILHSCGGSVFNIRW